MKPNRKLKKPQSYCSKFDLEEIIGLTVANGNGLASSVSYSKFVYMAGCVVVLYDVDTGTQSHLMASNRTPKPLNCVSVVQDGSYIAAGESGHQPAIIVWSSANLASVSELKGHRYGVACMAFSPDGKLLVSVGVPQDGYLCLWDWRSGILVKKLKACSSFSAVTSVSFSADANSIFTAGKKHLKIWTVELPTKPRAKALSLMMHGKTVNLGQHKGCTFIDITSLLKTNENLADGKGGDLVLAYALTDSGVLCVLHSGLTIMHTVNLKVEKGYALSASKELIACACSNGVVKLYTVGSLEYVGILHYREDKQSNKTIDTHHQSKVSQEGNQHLPTYPDALACQFSSSEKLVVVYRDHSLYIWNIHRKYEVTKCCMLVSHSACIWDIKNLSCENMHDPSVACVARGCTGGVSFATCSADGTIRLWDLALQFVSPESRSTHATGQPHLINEPLATSCLVSAGTFERESVVSGVVTQGYRSMAVSSDGRHLAAGDSNGNLHIFNLNTSDYTCIQDVHEADILSLNFSLPVNWRINSREDLESYYFLATGGRDRRIHLFDVNRNFDLIASVDDHSAPVTLVQLTGNGRKIISCSSDRSLISRDVVRMGKGINISYSHQQKAIHGTASNIAIDRTTETAVAVGQEQKINVFDIAVGKVIRSFKQRGDFGDPIKIALDPSCSYVVCSYADRSICMYDLACGEMVARAMGHGDAINGIICLPDCKHIVSVGSDGCIFVWKVPTLFTSRMLQKINKNSSPLSPRTVAQCSVVNQSKFYKESHVRSQHMLREGKCHQETSNFKFSVSRLPHWAKSKVSIPFRVPMDPIAFEVVEQEHSPSKSNNEGNASFKPALLTPSNHNTDARKLPSSSDPSNSKDSTTQGTCRSFGLDRRWFTIHTVCLDLLDSPEVYTMKEEVVPFSSDSSFAAQSLALEAPECSGRKRYSARFTVRRGETMSSDKETNLPGSSVFSVSEHEDSKRGSSSQQGMQCNSSSSSSKSTKSERIDTKDQQECDEKEKHKALDACKIALRSLDALSKTALQVFSKLRDITSTHEDTGPEAKFYAEAAEMLPLIAKNVHEIAKVASSCGMHKMEIPGYEQMLGNFAENLSQRVIELLKENCTSFG